MRLHLSTAEQQRLERATRTLLSPLDFATTDEWRGRVNRALCALVDADSAAFTLPDAQGDHIFSDEHSQEVLARYPELQPPPTRRGESISARLLADNVATIDSAYRTHDHEFYHSSYYNDYFRPEGIHNLVTAAYSVDGLHQNADPLRIVIVQLMRGPRTRDTPLGERERRLVRLVFPALVAGVDAWQRFHAARGALLATIDQLGQPVLVCDAVGRRVHQTPALTRTLAEDPESHILATALEGAVRMECGTGIRGTASREVRTRTASYRLNVSRCTSPNGSPPPLLLVALERCSPWRRSDVDLQATYGLTPAEVRVARLLAEGLRNREIAERLRRSEHTTRRQTEQVLLKLGIRSRAAVAARLNAQG